MLPGCSDCSAHVNWLTIARVDRWPAPPFFKNTGTATGSPKIEHDYRGRFTATTGQHGMVAADHGRCSDMGLKILQSGGNAVDATVTTALCQGIMNPMSSGLGGGAFILIR